MKYTFIQMATAKLIQNYEVVSEYDAKRLEVATELLRRDVVRTTVNGLNADSGLFGKVFELLMRKPNSKVTWVQAQGKSDYITNINGTFTHVEVKTNFGRIGNFYKFKALDTRYIVYGLCAENVAKYMKKDGTRTVTQWEIEPIIMRLSDFLRIAEKTDAIKYIEHKDAIKPDREAAIKQWYTPFYEALKAFDATPYNRLGNYKASDIK